jgi:hypothetical protein
MIALTTHSVPEAVEMSDVQEAERPLELEIPEGVPDAEQAVELIRAWVADGSLMVTLNGEAFGDKLQEWGRLLAQIGHHVVHASALSGQIDEGRSLAEIRKGFDAIIPGNERTLSGKVGRRITH